ncbi:MAG: Phage terminase small subunit [Verrucomicrobiales bacterium]|nr:Phage terminase small subunit [Verrucomicrobiales bacterium]
MNENTPPNPDPQNQCAGSPATLRPLPDETPEAFEAFLLYFDSSQKLTQPKIAEALGIHPNTVSNWSSKFQWRGRILRHRAQLLSYKLRAENAVKEQEALSQIELARLAKEHKIRTCQKLDSAADTLLDEYMVNGISRTRLGEIGQFYSLSSRIRGTLDAKSKSALTDPQLQAAEDRYQAEVDQVYGTSAQLPAPPAETPKPEPPHNPAEGAR